MTAWPRASGVVLALVFAVPRVLPAESEGTAPSDPRTPWSLASALSVSWLRSPGPRMLLVPSGTFTMGSTGEEIVEALVDCQHEQRGTECDPSIFADEGPVRTIALSPYFLDRTEVTVADYERCVTLGKCAPLPFSHGGRRFDRADYPATLVTWDEASAYCAFRGARLPTEAEFERAARGPTGRKYPWGNLYASGAANHGRFAWNAADASDGFAELAPVGSFPSGRSREGFDDLAGNVAEWVSDRYATEYVEADRVDPQGPPIAGSSPSHVVRGGSYESAAPFLRAAARGALDPDARRPTVGFRCARSRRVPRQE